MVIGAFILIALYHFVKTYNLHSDLFVIMIYPCGICLLMLIYQFTQLFNSLKENNLFCKDNIIKLKNGTLLCFVISLLIIIALMFSIFLYRNYYTFRFAVCVCFIGILFFGAGISLYILKELFTVATKYKEENDLTI